MLKILDGKHSVCLYTRQQQGADNGKKIKGYEGLWVFHILALRQGKSVRRDDQSRPLEYQAKALLIEESELVHRIAIEAFPFLEHYSVQYRGSWVIFELELEEEQAG